MEGEDLRAYQLLATLLNKTTHTPLFFDALEDFLHALISKNPAYREQIFESIPPSFPLGLRSFTLYKTHLLFPMLREPWVTAMDTRLSGVGPITTTTITYDSVPINTALRTLNPGMEINDEIVNAYLGLVRRAFSDTNRYHIATTRLLTPGKRLSPIDQLVKIEIFQKYDGTIIPVFHASHWTFVVLQYTEGLISVKYYDSLNSGTRTLPPPFLEWARHAFPGKEFYFEECNGPRQYLQNDCGVLMLMGIRLTAAGLSHLSQAESDEVIPKFRHRILSEILVSHLDPKPNEYTQLVEREEMFEGRYSPGKTAQAQPATYNATGTADDPLTIDDSPAEVLLKATGDGETFMGAPLDDAESVGLFAQEDLELPWPDQISGFITEEDPQIGQGVTVFEYSEPLSVQVSPEPRRIKRKDPEPLRIEEPDQILVDVLNAVSPIQEMPVKDKPVKNEEPASYARNFAEDQAMIELLRQAVLVMRISRTNEVRSKHSNLASLWSSLEAEDAKPRTLQTRHNRQQFSQQFYERSTALTKEIKKKSTASSKLRQEIGIGENGIEGARRWRLANLQAKRASVWTELSEIFLDSLGESRFVALSAVSEATTTLEVMSISQREVFLDAVRSRVLDPEDQMLKRLRAASPLYSALVNGNLPNTRLRIETQLPLHSAESFEEIVALKAVPSRRALPARSQIYRS